MGGFTASLAAPVTVPPGEYVTVELTGAATPDALFALNAGRAEGILSFEIEILGIRITTEVPPDVGGGSMTDTGKEWTVADCNIPPGLVAGICLIALPFLGYWWSVRFGDGAFALDVSPRSCWACTGLEKSSSHR